MQNGNMRQLAPVETLAFENDGIRREITFRNGRPVSSRFIRKESGYAWESLTAQGEVLSLPGFDWTTVKTSFDGDSGTFLFEGNYSVRWTLTVLPGVPAVRSQLWIKGLPEQLPEVIETVPHAGKHLTLRALTFYDRTDGCNSLLSEKTVFTYGNDKANYAHTGNLFFAIDPTVAESVMICKEAPVGDAQLGYSGVDLYAMSDRLCVLGCGMTADDRCADEYVPLYPVTVALCAADEEKQAQLARKYYAAAGGSLRSYVMSNTWGDRSRDTAVCEAFIMREIALAKEIGVDVVQIDDGWQTGKSANSAYVAETAWNSCFYAQNPDFWQPHPDKFPRGLLPICNFARQNGVEIGLWFSPDETDDYAAWERDADTLFGLWRQYGIRYYKMDGINVLSKKAEMRLQKLFETLRVKSHGEIEFNMDITAGNRFGYFAARHLGTLFVENRYTDWANYFPHATLRNLWTLSRYIPAAKLQMEVLNLRRNADKYLLPGGAQDPLAPNGYDADYVFASVMAACPLLWMEMQRLSDADRAALTKIVTVYRDIRAQIVDVIPRGECPTGYALTGFELRGKTCAWYLGIREQSPRTCVQISAERILASNDEGLVVEKDCVVFSGQRKYFLALLRADSK